MSAFFRRLRFSPAVAALCMLMSTTTTTTTTADFRPGLAHLRTGEDRPEAPDFTLIDANGAPVRLSGFRGRVVLLDFWATWCTGCKVEIPWYIAFQRKYARQGLTSIGVAMDDEGWQKVRPYLAVHPINYPIVLGNPDLVKPYQITSLPVTLLIDREGRIRDAHAGLVVKDTWEKEIQLLLKEPPAQRH